MTASANSPLDQPPIPKETNNDGSKDVPIDLTKVEDDAEPVVELDLDGNGVYVNGEHLPLPVEESTV